MGKKATKIRNFIYIFTWFCPRCFKPIRFQICSWLIRLHDSWKYIISQMCYKSSIYIELVMPWLKMPKVLIIREIRYSQDLFVYWSTWTEGTIKSVLLKSLLELWIIFFWFLSWSYIIISSKNWQVLILSENSFLMVLSLKVPQYRASCFMKILSFCFAETSLKADLLW